MEYWYRYRVSLIVKFDEMNVPVTFRTDVILNTDDFNRAKEHATIIAKTNPNLTLAQVLSCSTERVVYSPSATPKPADRSAESKTL